MVLPQVVKLLPNASSRVLDALGGVPGFQLTKLGVSINLVARTVTEQFSVIQAGAFLKL